MKAGNGHGGIKTPKEHESKDGTLKPTGECLPKGAADKGKK